MGPSIRWSSIQDTTTPWIPSESLSFPWVQVALATLTASFSPGPRNPQIFNAIEVFPPIFITNIAIFKGMEQLGLSPTVFTVYFAGAFSVAPASKTQPRMFVHQMYTTQKPVSQEPSAKRSLQCHFVTAVFGLGVTDSYCSHWKPSIPASVYKSVAVWCFCLPIIQDFKISTSDPLGH